MKRIYGLLALICFASASQAATISRVFDGNDCTGYFGVGDACAIFVNSNGVEITLSPVIAKYEVDTDGDLFVSETNGTVFPGIDGSEFSFSNLTKQNKTGTWSYDAGIDDPSVRYWVTKAGNNFTLSWEVDDSATLVGGACDVADVYTLSCIDLAQEVTTADWDITKSLSHITLYDTGIVVPVPAALLLFSSGLIGLVGIARRRRAV